MKEIAYVNGKTSDFESARISVLDRGFLFGDGIYEVVRVYQGVPFTLDRHLQRLQQSAEAIMLPLPHTMGTFEDIILDLIEESDCREGWVYLQVTRGVAPRTHAFPEQIEPTVVMFVSEVPSHLGLVRQQGASAITLPDRRWLMCNIKTVNLLGGVLGKETAHRQGALECLFYRDECRVTEGASSNAFALVDGVVRTHPAGNYILPGVTRDLVLEICADEGIPFEERAFSLEDLKTAGEVFVTGTISEVIPIVKVDGRVVGNGSPGPITLQLIASYAALVERSIR